MSHEASTTKSVEQRETTSPDADPWRYRCPHGHSSWVSLATSDEYKCKSCGSRFRGDELLDLKEENTNTADFAGGE
jgi:DNA-directed RNA polymerase subunit RPC12/RpoP